MSMIQTTEHTYCKACLGTKTIIGLGTISHTCKVCEGKGYVKRDQDNPVIVTTNLNNGMPLNSDTNNDCKPCIETVKPIEARTRGRQSYKSRQRISPF